MSKKGEFDKLNFDLDFPRVRVLQYSYVTMRNSWDNPSRNAPYWRFYWNKTPGASIRFQEKTIELKPENILLIPPHTNYASHSTGSFIQLYMHFEWEYGNVVSEPQLFSALPFQKHLLEAEKWFGREDEQFEIRMYALLLYYLAEFQRHNPVRRSFEEDMRIEKALELINADLRLSNRDIAEKVSMSQDNFQRIFRRQIGMTPGNYRISRRMEQAQELLQNSSLSIEDIAQRTGFCNRYQFSKAYKQFFKLSPGKVRKKNEK